jgi:3-oxoadipate enol-lactonase
MRVPRLRSLAAVAAAGLGTGVGGMVALSARTRNPDPESGPPDPPDSLPPAYTVRVPGHGELFVRDTGTAVDAPTILLLHGWMFPADLNWFPSYGPLGELGRVLAPDHRGHGRGTRPSAPFRLADVADDYAALLRRLDAAPAVLVGYSMGGPLAQLMWQRHPDVVAGMVMCATSATFSLTRRERMLWRGMGVVQVVLRLLPRGWYERLARAQARGSIPETVTRMINEATPAHVVALLPWITGELARGSAEDLAEAGRELGRYDARAWVTTVDVPTRVIVTRQDRLVAAERQRDLAARIPHADHVELDADHEGAVAAADQFVPALVEAVRRVLAAARAAPAAS